MAFELTEIEQICKKQVEATFDPDLWAGYVIARAKVFNELLDYIRIKEPFLTDHGPGHIIDVLTNAFGLLGNEGCAGKKGSPLEPAELFLLVLSILFHDVGNVFSRKGHKSRLTEAYEFARGTGSAFAQERVLLFRIIEAHGGVTSTGSPDTIGDGQVNVDGIFKGKRVDCKRIAAILRFADELAEGPQRTSLFMQKHLEIGGDAQVFHDYANVTGIRIGRKDGRIAIVYNIDLAPDEWGGKYDGVRLRALINFCFHRLEKLDLERKYNRHYCSLLESFKQTEATFHFHLKNKDLRLGLPKIVLNDLILPTNFQERKISEASADFEIDALMQRLESAAQPVTQPS